VLLDLAEAAPGVSGWVTLRQLIRLANDLAVLVDQPAFDEVEPPSEPITPRTTWPD
jgi:hypothetical protein